MTASGGECDTLEIPYYSKVRAIQCSGRCEVRNQTVVLLSEGGASVNKNNFENGYFITERVAAPRTLFDGHVMDINDGFSSTVRRSRGATCFLLLSQHYF